MVMRRMIAPRRVRAPPTPVPTPGDDARRTSECLLVTNFERSKDRTVKKLIFLHIPKTAGQSIRQELRRAFGRHRESPVKTKSLARKYGGTCFPDPDRHDLYSGHIDWHDLEDRIPGPKVVFTVLRDPRERLASFYFYQFANAVDLEGMVERDRKRLHAMRTLSVDDFLANPDIDDRARIDVGYDNVQARFLATRQLHLSNRRPGHVDDGEIISRAVENARTLDLVCTIDRLDRVEELVAREFGYTISVTTRFANRGSVEPGKSRFAELVARVKERRTRDRIEEMCALDDRLLAELGLPEPD